MISIILTIASQFLGATVSILDKYIVTSKTMPKPISYTFYVSLFAGLPAIVLIFFPQVWDFQKINLEYLIYLFIFGYSLLLAWYFLFSALKTTDASDVAPYVSAVSILFTWILSIQFGLDFGLGEYAFLGIVLLVIGTILTSHLRLTRKNSIILFLSGVFFAVNVVITKKIFMGDDFLFDLFTTRIFHVLTALSMLLFYPCRKEISEGTKEVGAKGGILVVLNRMLSAVSELLLLKAIQLGNVVIIQALKSVHFIFLFLFAFFFGKKTPQEYGENVNTKDLIQKAISTVLMVAGFILLFV